jgi:hypothetical protein
VLVEGEQEFDKESEFEGHMSRSLMKAVRATRLVFSKPPSVRTINFLRRHAAVAALSTAVCILPPLTCLLQPVSFCCLTAGGPGQGVRLVFPISNIRTLSF